MERVAFINAGVAAFVLVAADLDGPEMATVFRKALRRMRHMARDTPRPFIALVTADAKVTFFEGGARLKRMET
jgi:hypothetical protein